MRTRYLVAGIGNVFFGDDAFGVEVARRLSAVPLPPAVRVEDFGIRGVHLAYELLDDICDTLVLVDALPLGDEPGTIAVLEVDADDVVSDSGVVEAHSMNPAVVLSALHMLGGHVDRVLVVGCQPAVIDEGMGLSPAVEAAVDEAVRIVFDLVTVGVPVAGSAAVAGGR